MVTVNDAVEGPLHPEAVAVITEVPLQLTTYVTVPVDELILFPPEILAASKL